MNEQFRSRLEAELHKIADSLTKKGGKGTEPLQEIKRTVTAIKWAVKEGVDINARSGVYFLRTCIDAISEQTVWQFYNTIREVEAFQGAENRPWPAPHLPTKRPEHNRHTCTWGCWPTG